AASSGAPWLVRGDAGGQGDAVVRAGLSRSRIRRGAADAPFGIAIELVARGVSDRDQIERHTLKRTCRISPSFTRYVFPSVRMTPSLFAFASLPALRSSCHPITSARMKPRSRSVWIAPAAC